MWDDNNRNNGRVRKGGAKTAGKDVTKQMTSFHFLRSPNVGLSIHILNIFFNLLFVHQHLCCFHSWFVLNKTGTKTSRSLTFLNSLSSYRQHNSSSVPKLFCKWSSFLSVLAPYRDQHHWCNSVTPEVRLCSCLNSALPITTRQCRAGNKEGFYF